jgi:hypothetical protein
MDRTSSIPDPDVAVAVARCAANAAADLLLSMDAKLDGITDLPVESAELAKAIEEAVAAVKRAAHMAVDARDAATGPVRAAAAAAKLLHSVEAMLDGFTHLPVESADLAKAIEEVVTAVNRASYMAVVACTEEKGL